MASPPTARYTTRHIWTLAWPIILSNITVPLLGLVDTAVVGHLPDSRYLAAVTLGATLFSFLYWGFGFLRMGTTGLTSQAVGREDDSDVRQLLAQSLVMAGVIGALLILFSTPLIDFGLWLLDGSKEAMSLAASYAHIRIFSAPAVLANYAILGWFIGQQKTRITLAILLLTNGVNIALDLLFVAGFGMASDGVAWASLIADYSALAFGLWRVAVHCGHLGGRLDRAALKAWSHYAALIGVNQHLFVRTLGLLFAQAFFTAQGANFGDTVLAANAVLLQFIMLTSFALDGFANAAEALTGRAVGKRHWDDFGDAVRAAGKLSLLVAGAAMLLFALGGNALIAQLTDLPEVRATAADYLPWMIAMPALAVWSYLLDGVFIGATASRAMRDTVWLAIACYLPAWWLTQSFGNHGLWFSFLLFTFVRSASLGACYVHYRRTRWRAGVAA
ncbi:MATE family efflux transporter [Salinicola rhizosphaerae]|uniref:MATE family efflux transporter n=1 Tax=Salinicola rhizosphaerae TaxID=1443141 RepID=A0ABQ3EBE6_9GAMM|nr:MATE family efflux transporter [Salinicola rhizosphaerae]GHB32367.1 MATE family efflux transporter [Salinicola rhizosphaerae]